MSERRIVVVGAGGSGIPLAARLGLAGHEVTLVEAGERHPVGLDAVTMDGLHDVRTVHRGLPGAATAWTYATELVAGHAYGVARGRTLGGSSAVNGGYFLRAHPDDFARWAEFGGAEWSYGSCLGALRRLESDRDFPADRVHGSDGPVPVSRSAGDAVTAGFIESALGRGARAEADKNAGGESGVGVLPCNALGGQRWGTDRAYAEMLRDAAVDVRVGLDVRRVVLDGDRAVGIEVAGAGGPELIRVDEVVLCAGAIETPRLLLRSGIGGAQSRHRGIGRGLSDHAAVSVGWRMRPGVLTDLPATGWTAAWNAPAGALAEHPLEVLLPVLSTNALVSGDAHAEGSLDLRVSLSLPASRGAVGTGNDGVDIRYGYLSEASERSAMRAGVRAALAVLADMADVVASVELVDRFGPVPSDAQLDTWILENLGTALHSCGTARMGDGDDPDAVVDAHGRVHGVAGLRIADTSILPVVPTRGTSNTAVMLGERIAELITAE